MPLTSRRDASLTSIDQLSARIRDELANFTLAATALEGKDATLLGWDGPAEALALLARLAVKASR